MLDLIPLKFNGKNKKALVNRIVLRRKKKTNKQTGVLFGAWLRYIQAILANIKLFLPNFSFYSYIIPIFPCNFQFGRYFFRNISIMGNFLLLQFRMLTSCNSWICENFPLALHFISLRTNKNIRRSIGGNFA